jgi:hypothetical protein
MAQQPRDSGGSRGQATIGRSGLRATLVTGVLAVAALIGCGGPPRVSFKAKPQMLPLRVGKEVTVQKSVGEFGSPWSTECRVICARHPPSEGDCSPSGVVFRAVGAGTAAIVGQIPCHVPVCAAAGVRILVLVRPS